MIYILYCTSKIIYYSNCCWSFFKSSIGLLKYMHNVKAYVFTLFTFYVLHFVYPDYYRNQVLLVSGCRIFTENDIFRRKNLEYSTKSFIFAVKIRTP